jgi:dynein heavy chain 1, cytosolic
LQTDILLGLSISTSDVAIVTDAMEVLSPGTSNGVAASDPLPSTDPLLVLEHLSEVLQVTLGAARRELEAVGSLLSKAKHADSINRCARFASESQVALYAQKDIVEEDDIGVSDLDIGLFPPICSDIPR